MAKLADKMYLKRLLETSSVTGMESLVASFVSGWPNAPM